MTTTSPKPTILAFHGSGSNATIHTVQLARLMRILKPHFELVSVEAPFPSPAGPGILPFFTGCGPYYRWLPPSEQPSLAAQKSGQASSNLPDEVWSLLVSTVSEATASGSKIVGLVGFSQGTRVVAGLAQARGILEALDGQGSDTNGFTQNRELAWLADLKFALSVCGSYPPALLPAPVSGLVSSSAASTIDPDERQRILGRRIGLPTLHVQGKKDEWEWAGKLLIENAYEVGEGMSEVLEGDMGHSYPVQASETERVAEWVMKSWGGRGA